MIHVHSKRFVPVLSVCSKQHYDNICMIRRRRNLFDCNAGRLDWQCMGRLGQLHCLSFACFRERVGSPGRNSQNTCGLIMLVFVLVFHQEAIKIALKSKTHVKILLPSNTSLDNDLGVQAPTGFWDPAGFTADGSVEDFKRRRQTELKHGRISMLATMGYITPEQLGKLCKTRVTSRLRRLQSTNANVQHDVCCILPNAHGCDEVVF